MDFDRGLIVICLTLGIVIIVNLAIFGLARSKSTIGQIELLRRAGERAKRPWGQEDDALQELSRRVEALKPTGTSQPIPPPDPGDKPNAQ